MNEQSNTDQANPIDQRPAQWFDAVAAQVSALDKYIPCMSYNDSYFTEPAGLVKRTVRALSKLIDKARRPGAANAPEPIAVIDLPPFPTIIRKMWSGGEVQRWIEDNIKPLVQELHHDFHADRIVAPPDAKPDMKEGRWCPDECPITGMRFFMWLDHPELGYVPTYGGPFDSFTIAEPDEDGLFRAERYDHDEGSWIEGGEPVHVRDELTVTAEIEAESQVATVQADTPDKVTCARMGYGTVAVGDCFSAEVGEPGIIFMELGPPRPIGTDTSDVYPEGSPARNVLAYVSFANAGAVDQVVDVLHGIRAKHWPAQAIVAVEDAGGDNAHYHADAIRTLANRAQEA